MSITVNVLWHFLTVTWVGLQCVIVAFLDYTHLLFVSSKFCHHPDGEEKQLIALLVFLVSCDC